MAAANIGGWGTDRIIQNQNPIGFGYDIQPGKGGLLEQTIEVPAGREILELQTMATNTKTHKGRYSTLEGD